MLPCFVLVCFRWFLIKQPSCFSLFCDRQASKPGADAMDLESWQDLPLETMLKEAADPLSREDTRLPTAFALLDRLKVCT
jgi:hypothetical protein